MNLQQQVVLLQNKLKEMEEKLNPVEEAKDKEDYYTDEEELTKEMEWMRAKNKSNKKRKIETPLTPPPPTTIGRLNCKPDKN
jgi:hypothetical protein